MALHIGVTGHQQLGNRLLMQRASHSEHDAWAWTEKVFRDFLNEQQQPLLVISSLAVGADQQLSLVARDSGAKISVVIPAQGMIDTFESDSEKETYQKLLQQAESVHELNYIEPSENAYYEAGKWMVDHSDTIVAVWDGEDAAGLGGTGDAVAYALARGKKVLQIDPIQRVVHHLLKGS